MSPFNTPVAFPMITAVCLVALLGNISAIERFYTIALAIRVREAEEATRANTLDTADTISAPTLIPSEEEGWGLRHDSIKARKSDFRA
jgi:hypothetical protein